ncbi:MAG: FKBP-type peptidyl-prolyl cis-trans isomerase [Bacteroidota bacterium]
MKSRIMEKLKVAIFLLSLSILLGCEDTDSNFAGVTRTVEQQLAFDIERIEGYLNENDLTGFTQTSEGIFYRVDEPGNGIFPQAGQTVFVDYVGTTIERTVFDQSIEGIPLEFVLGVEEVIEGWDIGIGLFQEESSGILIIPSTLGYGSQTQTAGNFLPIEPNSILIFDITVVALR